MGWLQWPYFGDGTEGLFQVRSVVVVVVQGVQLHSIGVLIDGQVELSGRVRIGDLILHAFDSLETPPHFEAVELVGFLESRHDADGGVLHPVVVHLVLQQFVR